MSRNQRIGLVVAALVGRRRRVRGRPAGRRRRRRRRPRARPRPRPRRQRHRHRDRHRARGQPAEPPVTRISVKGGVIAGDVKSIEVAKGDTVRIVVSSDVDGRDPPARVRHREGGGAREAGPLRVQGRRRGRVRAREPRGGGRRQGAVAGPPARRTVVITLFAHAGGLIGRSDLPIPEWLFGWAAAMVLVISFVALAILWPEPKLEGDRWRPLPGGGRAGQPGRSRSSAARSASGCWASSSTPASRAPRARRPTSRRRSCS